MSPQSFNGSGWTSSTTSSSVDQPEWLKGIVHGPQVRVSLPDLRAEVPTGIRSAAIRTSRIPAIAVSRAGWDLAYAITEGREPINPRPMDEAAIFRSYRQDTDRLHHVLRRL